MAPFLIRPDTKARKKNLGYEPSIGIGIGFVFLLFFIWGVLAFSPHDDEGNEANPNANA